MLLRSVILTLLKDMKLTSLLPGYLQMNPICFFLAKYFVSILLILSEFGSLGGRQYHEKYN